jgi:hypothetical protein
MSRRIGLYAKGALRRIYLYFHGIENTSITGGVKGYNYAPSGAIGAKSAPAISRGDSEMSVSSTGNPAVSTSGTVYTESKVDLTDVKTIKINVSSITVGTSAFVFFGVATTKADGYTNAAKKDIRETGVLSLDVSELSGKYYLTIILSGPGVMSVKFTEWWIE